MWKKILAGFIIGISILAASSFSYAEDTADKVKVVQEVDLSKYQIIKPEKRAYTIEEKVDFINGIAPAGTTITIEVYGTTDLTRKNFNLLTLPSEDDYIEVFTETITAGNSGTFSKQLELVTGINKVIINFGVEGVPSEEIIIFVNPKTIREVKRPDKLIDIIIQN